MPAQTHISITWMTLLLPGVFIALQVLMEIPMGMMIM
jgi:hypothetical protein